MINNTPVQRLNSFFTNARQRNNKLAKRANKIIGTKTGGDKVIGLIISAVPSTKQRLIKVLPMHVPIIIS